MKCASNIHKHMRMHTSSKGVSAWALRGGRVNEGGMEGGCESVEEKKGWQETRDGKEFGGGICILPKAPSFIPPQTSFPPLLSLLKGFSELSTEALTRKT